MTQNTRFMATIEKIITHALGEHHPGSAQDGRTSSETSSPLPVMNRKIVIPQSSMITSFENLRNSAKVRTSLG